MLVFLYCLVKIQMFNTFWRCIILALPLTLLYIFNSNCVTGTGFLSRKFALCLSNPLETSHAAISFKSTWFLINLKIWASWIQTGLSHFFWPSHLFYQCPLDPCWALIQPAYVSTSLKLTQIFIKLKTSLF